MKYLPVVLSHWKFVHVLTPETATYCIHLPISFQIAQSYLTLSLLYHLAGCTVTSLYVWHNTRGRDGDTECKVPWLTLSTHWIKYSCALPMQYSTCTIVTAIIVTVCVTMQELMDHVGTGAFISYSDFHCCRWAFWWVVLLYLQFSILTNVALSTTCQDYAW